MPLRLIVQALFVQQLNTHKAFKECSDSFRYATNCGELSGSLSSSRCPCSASQNLGESPYNTDHGPELQGSRPLSFLMQKDIVMQNFKFSTTTEYESTSFRIQNLEQELMSLKRSLQLQNIVTKAEPKNLIKAQKVMVKPCGLEARSLSKRRNPIGQATSCISSVNFASQRKYANRLLKVFRRITLFGSRKLKRKQGTPSQLSKSIM